MADLPKIFITRAEARTRLASFLSDGLRKLLEEMHQYQSRSFDVGDLCRKAAKGKSELSKNKHEKQELAKYLQSPWIIEPPKLPAGPPLGSLTAGDSSPVIKIPTLKLFCRRCKRIEAHNLICADDPFNRSRFWGLEPQVGDTQQAFLLGYLCQSCKVVPNFFLIRRENLKLVLCGRSPMEYIDMPSYIPKMQRLFYRDAIIAFQSGQVLPALFMLRSFIEQFVAKQVASAGLKADKILDKYTLSLPKTVRENFPSLRDIYGQLSEAIHAANTDESLFKSALQKVNHHFEGRKAHKVGTPKSE
jgi:hypothetical protein